MRLLAIQEILALDGLALPLALIARPLVAPGKVGQMELEREAPIAAKRIATEMRDEPDALIDAFASPSFGPASWRHPRRRATGIECSATSSMTKTATGLHQRPSRTRARLEDPPLCSRAPRAGAKVTLYRVRPSHRSPTSRSYPAACPERRAAGTLLVYLDQSDQAKVLCRYFGLIAAITLLLLGAGVAMPAACLDPGPRARARPKRKCAISRITTRSPASPIANRSATARNGHARAA